MEEKGIQGRWKGRQLQDSIQVFADLVKKHYGKYPIIYSNESFYNKEMGAKFNRYYLFIANYNSRNPLSAAEESAISGSIPKPDICMVLEKG